MSCELPPSCSSNRDRLVDPRLASALSFLVITKGKGRPLLKVRSILRRTEEDVFREDLLAYLRQHITDQRRVDSLAAPAPAHVLPSATLDGGMLGGGGKGAAAQAHGPDLVRLILPSDKPGKDWKGGQHKKLFRHGTKALYYEKARTFLALVRSPLPLFAVDVPACVLSLMALDTAWLDAADEPAVSNAWRTIKEKTAPGQTAYMAMVRDELRDAWTHHLHLQSTSGASGPEEAPMVWLFSVREERAFLLQWPPRS